MSYSTENDIQKDEAKGRLKLILIAVAVAVAIGLAVWSGIRSQPAPITIVGTLGADGKVKLYSDQKGGAPAPTTVAGKKMAVDPQGGMTANPPSKD